MRNLLFIAVFLIAAASVYSAEPPAGRIVPSDHSLRVTLTKRKAGEAYRYTVFDRAAIRQRMASDSRYAAALEETRKGMAEFIALDDGQIRSLILPADTKRALMVHRKGCPVHGGGTGVYQPFGQRVDIHHPGQVQCPIGEEWYPNADFPDDGSGWLDNRPGSPTKGEWYYFVGWYNQWFLNSLPQYLKPLSMLWFLTGEEVYRHKATVLLERFMEVYPNIDSHDLTYDGADWGTYVKMTGSFWEGSLLLDIAKSVEILSPGLDADFLQRVEEKIYRPAYAAYRAKPSASNWGNNWNQALAKFAAVTGDEDMLGFMLNDHPAAEAPVLDNQFFRDGFPFEASLSYASTYHEVAKSIAEAMGSDGRWVWDHPHMRASFRSFADLVCLDRFTHFASDMGSIINTGWTLPLADITDAYQAYHTPELARYLLRAREIAGSPAPALEDLFHPALDLKEVQRTAARAQEERSTIAPVRGLAVLRTGKGEKRAALFLDYGFAHTAHSHADRLNINFFAEGREFIPEMGYPEYMDHIAPATGGWTTHTVCHATVEVDEKRQAPGTFGDLHAFADLDGVKYIDASCEDAYSWCGVDRYRRTLLLIDLPGGAYTVDLFRVRGGNRHDYLFHGPIGELELEGPALSAPASGTLAGVNVPFGLALNDGNPYDTANSGYQYLYDVRTSRADSLFSAVWTLPDSLKFRATFVPEGSETFIRAQGYPRPATKLFPPMPFLVRRHDHPDGAGESRFATVLSTERGAPVIREVRKIELTGDSKASGYALLVRHAYGEDIIVSTISPDARVKSADGSIELCGMLGVLSRRTGQPARMTLVGGTSFRVGTQNVRLARPVFTSTVREVGDDYLALRDSLPAVYTGRMLFADRGPVRSVYRVTGVRGAVASVYPPTWIGRGRVGTASDSSGTVIDGRAVFPLGETSTLSREKREDSGARNYYAGAWLTTPDGRFSYPLSGGGNAGFVIAKGKKSGSLNNEFPKGSDFYLYDLGPGDRVYLLNMRQVRLK